MLSIVKMFNKQLYESIFESFEQPHCLGICESLMFGIPLFVVLTNSSCTLSKIPFVSNEVMLFTNKDCVL